MVLRQPIYSWVLKRCVKLQLLLVLLISLTIFFRVFPLELQKRIVNDAIRFRDTQKLFYYCGFYLASVILAGVLKYAINVLQGYIGQRLLDEMRTSLYDHIIRLPMNFFRKTAPGMVIASLTSELNIIGEFAGSALAVPLINVLTLLAFGGYMFYLNPLLAGLSMAIYPFEIGIIPILQGKVNRLNRDRIDLTRSLSNAIGEAIAGIHEIHGSASYDIESEKCSRYSRRIFFVRHRINLYKYLIKFTNNLFQSLGPFLLFLVGGYLAIHGRFNLGALVAFLSAYEKLYDPWKELMDFFQTYQDTRVRHRRIVDTFDLQPEFALRPQGRDPYQLQGKIEIKDMSFEGEGHIRLLDKISIDLEAGDQLAVVGLSGSGKSTLAMVISQLYRYGEGRVLVDGHELKELSKADVSLNTGYVAQYPFIFEGTIKANLLYACQALARIAPHQAATEPTPEQIVAMIEHVGLREDIVRFGLNTVIGENERPEIVSEILRLRHLFQERWQAELAGSIEFFVEHKFLEHSDIRANIIFGYSRRDGDRDDSMRTSRLLVDFLEQAGLLEPLVQLGAGAARRTVSLLKDLRGDSFFFKQSPIPQERLDRYIEVVKHLDKGASLSEKDREALLWLALRFVPGRHKMVSITPEFKERILEARKAFRRYVRDHDPDAFDFYDPEQYLYGRSLIENIIFGSLFAERPDERDRLFKRIVELLKENSLFESVIELGLDFNVGSKGDRLSGGQKQRIALARIFLKQPRILVLDEATASLDAASQHRVLSYLAQHFKGRSTIIAVVHRLETIRDFEKVAVMQAGRIVEMGSYRQLMERKGLFYELVQGI